MLCSPRECNSKKYVFSLAHKVDSELTLRMSFGDATQNAIA